MPAFIPHHEPCMDALADWYERLDPRMGTLRTPAPPLAVVVAGRIVAQCTTPAAHEAARRLLGVAAATRNNP